MKINGICLLVSIMLFCGEGLEVPRSAVAPVCGVRTRPFLTEIEMQE